MLEIKTITELRALQREPVDSETYATAVEIVEYHPLYIKVVTKPN